MVEVTNIGSQIESEKILTYQIGSSTKQPLANPQTLQYLSLQNHEGLSETLRGQHEDSDLVSGVYEGGLKVWDCAFDLVDFVQANKETMITGKRVLELGCGQGLPGIMAMKSGAAKVVFADFNNEVLQKTT